MCPRRLPRGRLEGLLVESLLRSTFPSRTDAPAIISDYTRGPNRAKGLMGFAEFVQMLSPESVARRMATMGRGGLKASVVDEALLRYVDRRPYAAACTLRLRAHSGYVHMAAACTWRLRAHGGYVHTVVACTWRLRAHGGYVHMVVTCTRWLLAHGGYVHTVAACT